MIPSFFIAHGAPSLAIKKNGYTRFLEEHFAGLPRPRAVVLFTAHWEASMQMISGVDQYGMIYDFRGFSPELYEMVYPAKGDVELAEEIADLYAKNGISCQIDDKRGIDHGAWVVLHLIYPAADIPVVAMSVNPTLSPEEQYEIGKILAPLKERDVLIMGSGGTVHNLSTLDWHKEEEAEQASADWANQFDKWLEIQLNNWNLDQLFRYEEKSSGGLVSVPTNEHFIPLFIAMGAGDQNRKARLLYRSYQYGTLSLSCWQFD
ncbi:DODA-type extradiol aromatic ring-opening family dioxygenase [Thermoflavimicrobium dichotomicum]|uniref:4,5-DOPA dioxygenase extradiol n=1 Tax=Thermoflavimicrobium dichotomicum TaxID=46223 RepID=A0A1I3REJ3_9BACL|nr:class III extradiol ring-cleavage dioxygenase [Thermoflavimicrobium dichotomicum]SFJ43717.1 4,5-DOPA dioxygenase extradiol [Thermoflavimicrobium dichotomicum]